MALRMLLIVVGVSKEVGELRLKQLSTYLEASSNMTSMSLIHYPGLMPTFIQYPQPISDLKDLDQVPIVMVRKPELIGALKSTGSRAMAHVVASRHCMLSKVKGLVARVGVVLAHICTTGNPAFICVWNSIWMVVGQHFEMAKLLVLQVCRPYRSQQTGPL